MKITKKDIQKLVSLLGFKPQEGSDDIHFKNYLEHDNYVIKVDFKKEKIDYGTKIKVGDQTTSNFESSENFVVLEAINRIIEKGYAPDKLSLEHKWPMGRKEKGKLDILVLDKDDKAYLMIECKTWGEEFEKEKRKMQKDGGQLFSYFQQDKAAQYLCLYASQLDGEVIKYVNEIVDVDAAWKELDNQKEVFDHWNKNFKDNGIFEDWAHAYDIEIKALTRGRLKELTEEDSGRIYNQFAEILRHNVVSDKPNAFNKIFNLFLCKIVDENRTDDEELKFQWLESDSNEELQKRLSDLYKQGMKEYLTKEVTDYNDEQVEEKLYALDADVRDQIREMFTRVRLHKNNEFAFKEVFDEKSFEENAVVVREVVELLQPYQLRYGHKQQFLGDFFELLLSTGIKQEAGQFFTPVPIAKFIISSLPLRELIKQKIESDETQFLPYIIDYAAGSGHFLTESMDEVQNIINEIDESKQRPSVSRNLSSWKINPFDWAYDYVYGIEADYRLVKTAKVSCFLNGDGLANVIHADGLDHFQKSTDYKGKLKKVCRDNNKDNGMFDVLIANPPYSVSAFKNTLKNGEESFELFNRITDDSSEIECLFIERTKQLLRPGGWAGVILPSSILSNSGIYVDAREIILKYFNIKAIAEFGSNTFMATGTNTVTLFLERRANNDWKKIEAAINQFFSNPKEATVIGIEKAFSKYVGEVFEDISLQDYITFINKEPNEAICKTELFSDYNAWFNGLTEIKNLKKKKSFTDKTKAEQNAELDKLFYESVFCREQDKMLYFLLTQLQKVVVIKVGDKQAEKDFIGYEFSNRRGHEGLKMYRDESGKLTTKLFDDEKHFNQQKANSYIYKAFLGENLNIDKSLENNVQNIDLIDLMDFKKVDFNKGVSLGVKKSVKIQSKWDFKRIETEFNVDSGTNAPQDKSYFVDSSSDYFIRASHVNYTDSEGYIELSHVDQLSKKAIDSLKLKKFPKNSIVFPKSGQSVNTNNIALLPSECYVVNHLACIYQPDVIKQKYLFNYLKLYKTSNFSEKSDYPSINLTAVREHKFPLPPRDKLEKIVNSIEAVEADEKKNREKLQVLNDNLNELFSAIDYSSVKLSKIADFKNGLNYSEKSTGDLVTIVGVKDFLEDFSPDLNKLVKVRIDGTLQDSYKLQPNDILVVRSNGSANLVGRFVFIDNIKEVTSYSGFTIRIRSNSKRINSKYLCYCLRTESIREKLTKDPKGANIKSVNQTMLSDINVPLPPIDIQKSIIEKAESLEKAIAKIESDLDTIDQQKEQILKNHLM
ncbi:N-6 DNA methylase [Pseudoalteromonas sp. 68 DY56-GL68]|uniref:N-6 DNA methylase n=1 Tax=Pseudoalteromonas sp. 68 DY56-GL68 TaxID=2974919 RepID=UPI00352ADD51